MDRRARKTTVARCVGLLLLAASAGHSRACADEVADFYRGKTINVYIGVNVGGGYDFQARLLARFMKAHIPGNPTLVPQNIIGAGGIKMANYLYSIAPQDGTAIGMVPHQLGYPRKTISYAAISLTWAVSFGLAFWSSSSLATSVAS